MRALALPLAGALLLLTLAPALVGQEKKETVNDSPYYPLRKGWKWDYRVGEKDHFTVQVVGQKKIGETVCAQVDTTEGGKLLVSEFVAVNSEGVCRFAINNDPADHPFCILKLPPTKGEKWEVNCKIKDETVKGTFVAGEAKDVVVPAGKFDTVTAESKDLEIGGFKSPCIYYFAKDVGIVKQVFTSGSQKVEVVLEKYSGPK